MGDETIARLRISLDDIEPEIWRTVDMPVAGSLKMLHDVIQAAMGWRDYHLWEFEAGERRYGLPDPDWTDGELTAAKNVKLAALIDRGIRDLTYTYDMGDDWRHTIVIEAVGPGQPTVKYPRYIDGARRAPPEDVGGVPGFENFLDAIASPKHPEHKDIIDWHFEGYGCGFNPDTVDDLPAKLRVGEIAKRRAAGKIAYEKRRTRH